MEEQRCNLPGMCVCGKCWPKPAKVSEPTKVIRKDLDKFKVAIINCDGWIVPPSIEAALKELCKKHNELIDYLS